MQFAPPEICGSETRVPLTPLYQNATPLRSLNIQTDSDYDGVDQAFIEEAVHLPKVLKIPMKHLV